MRWLLREAWCRVFGHNWTGYVLPDEGSELWEENKEIRPKNYKDIQDFDKIHICRRCKTWLEFDYEELHKENNARGE